VTEQTNQAVIRDVFDAIERRDGARLAKLYHPEIEFRWPPGLPYGGMHRGVGIAAMRALFAEVWFPLQPTEADRQMDLQIIAAQGENVAAKYVMRGRDAEGRMIAADTMAHYRVRDDMLISAQMYHFDLTGLLSFLSRITAIAKLSDHPSG
jgi:ketosteroid isomerase-like protein